jgi:hypothetical protein
MPDLQEHSGLSKMIPFGAVLGSNYAVFVSDHPLALTCLPLGHLPLISAFHESSLESKRM